MNFNLNSLYIRRNQNTKFIFPFTSLFQNPSGLQDSDVQLHLQSRSEVTSIESSIMVNEFIKTSAPYPSEWYRHRQKPQDDLKKQSQLVSQVVKEHNKDWQHMWWVILRWWWSIDGLELMMLQGHWKLISRSFTTSLMSPQVWKHWRIVRLSSNICWKID
mgnify:CR=1 FL=1